MAANGTELTIGRKYLSMSSSASVEAFMDATCLPTRRSRSGRHVEKVWFTVRSGREAARLEAGSWSAIRGSDWSVVRFMAANGWQAIGFTDRVHHSPSRGGDLL